MSHNVIVIIDYHDVFIKGHSQAICMFLFFCMFLLRYRLICNKKIDDSRNICRERCVLVLVLVFFDILRSSKFRLSQSYLLSFSMFLSFLTLSQLRLLTEPSHMPRLHDTEPVGKK